MKFNTCIIGAGPAGLFAAYNLKMSGKTDFMLIEKGKSVDKRLCPRNENKNLTNCLQCNPCNISCGIGGAGTNSDGKITLTPEFGGNLHEYMSIQELNDYIAEVDKIFIEYGAPENGLFKPSDDDCKNIIKLGNKHGMRIIPAVYRHLGTDGSKLVVSNLYNKVKDHIVTEKQVTHIMRNSSGEFVLTVTDCNKPTRADLYTCKNLIIATGREGSIGTVKMIENLGIKSKPIAVDIGVRVETLASIAEELTDKFYEVKCLYNTPTYDDRVRTFCMCPHGEVTTEYNKASDIVTVNGHSNRYEQTENTNFAILVSKTFTEPFNDPNSYATHIARLANLLADGGNIVQRLGDLRNGRRSTADRILRGMVRPTLQASPGDLSLVLPHRHLVSILEMFEALNHVIPGINHNDTLLYGVEIKLYSNKYDVDSTMMSKQIPNLYLIGDGSGVSRGICQAAVSGLLAAMNI